MMLSLPAEMVREVMTYPSAFPETVGGAQPTALLAELNYDDALAGAPIAVVMHQFSASSGNFDNYRSNALTLRDLGFFVITPSMRGRDGSDGRRDSGGREVHDIYDAVEAVKARYPELVDPGHVYITGYSGGGGNTLSALTKFPDYWNAAASFFGISDYGYDSESSWYFHGSKANHQSTLRSDVGNPTAGDPLVIDRFYARASDRAAGNNPYAEIHLFVNEDEALTPLYQHQSYYTRALAAESFTGEFANVTHHVGYPDLYVDFNQDGQDSADELQYWVHQKQNADQQAAAERWFIDRMVAKQIPTPELNRADTMHVAGYLKTEAFALYLGDGQNAAGALTYDLSSDTYTFDLDILSSDETVPALLRVNTRHHVGKRIEIRADGALVKTTLGGGWVETDALRHATTVTLNFSHEDSPLLPVYARSEAVSYWRFESSGSLLDDSGAGAQGLVIEGDAPTFFALPASGLGSNIPGTIPQSSLANAGAALLNRAGYFSAGSGHIFHLSAFTLEAIVSTEQLHAGTQYIASKYHGVDSQRGWSLGITGTNAVPGTSSEGELFMTVSKYGSDATVIGSGQSLQPGNDYYVSVSYMPGGPILFRVMNLSQPDATITRTLRDSPVSSLFETSAPLLVGAYNGGQNAWDGIIDELRVSPGVLLDSHLMVSSGIRRQDWQDYYFTHDEQADGLLTLPESDPDNDGISNWLEFAAGTDPRQSNARPLLVSRDADGVRVSVQHLDIPELAAQLWYTDDLNGVWLPAGQHKLVEQSAEGYVLSESYAFEAPAHASQLYFKTSYTIPES